MATIRQTFARFVGALLLSASGCSHMITMEVRPSDCINPPQGNCLTGAAESRILDVRLYQLKDAVDPCKLDLELFLQGKDQEALKGLLVETANKQTLQFPFKVSANDPRSLGTWQLGTDTRYLLALALGRGRSRNTVRLIPITALGKIWRFYVHGYDICTERECTNLNTEAQCPQ
jgi:hypothetical protein